jgi:hypothetical protein
MAAPIFISYAHEDRARAEQFAARLSASGWSVWWDRQITGGSHFDKATEKAIAAAKIVVVLWSRASVGSHWVRAEAAWALAKDKLLPVKIHDVDPPLQFFHVQTIDLVGLNVTRETPALRQLLAELAQRLGDGGLRAGLLTKRDDRSRGSAGRAPGAIDPPRGIDAPPRWGDRAGIRLLPPPEAVNVGPTLPGPQRLPLALLGAVLATLIIGFGYVVLVGASTPITKPELPRTNTAIAGSAVTDQSHRSPVTSRPLAPTEDNPLWPNRFPRP